MTSAEPGQSADTATTDAATQTGENAENIEGAEALGDAGKRALDRIKAERDAERTQRGQIAAERDAMAKRLKEIDDRDLSELQLAQRDREAAQAALAALQTESEALRLDSLRKQVAIDKGLPAALVGRLQGNTVEELGADADNLLGLINKKPELKPDPSQGPRGGGSGTPEQQFAAALGPLLS